MVLEARPNPRDVFVVHGRNADARDAMFVLLRAFGLRPIEWSQAVESTGKGSPYIGEVLDAAFGQAQAVVVLMTPDEIAYLRPEYCNGEHDSQQHPATQARPNVLFEAGMAMGRNSDRTIIVEMGDLRAFSDFAGRHAIRMDDDAVKRKELGQRLKTAGCDVDMSGEDWMTAGAFVRPEAPGAGLPLGRRVPPSESPSRMKLDLRYHDRSKSGRLEIINLGTEAAYDIGLELPENLPGFHLVTDDLPIKRLPPGKSVSLLAMTTASLDSKNSSYFDVTVSCRSADGEQFTEEIFVSVAD